MSDAGYKQAIENVAYEMDKLSVEVDNLSDSPIKNISTFTLGVGYGAPLKERARELDEIIATIANTYHRSDAEIDMDITKALQKRTLECPK